MKKAVWTAFLVALVVINGLAWLVDYFTGLHIPLPYRLTVVLSITFITLVFAGAAALVSQADTEIPLTRYDEPPESAPGKRAGDDPDSPDD
ncbi:MAG: hypothetical protein WEB57_07125 [Pseudohongiellaceae bacterium]